MNAALFALVSRVVESVLEHFAFMFTIVGDEAASAIPDTSFIRASMMYSGPEKGALTIIMPTALACEVAANVLGVSEISAHDDTCIDAVQELLNLICGRLVSELHGTAPVFELTAPEGHRVGRAEWDTCCADGDNLVFTVEDQPLLLNVTVMEGAYARE